MTRRILARPWVDTVEDNRAQDGVILVTLKTPYCFEADPGCGTRGFSTMREAEQGTRVAAIYEPTEDPL